MADFTANYGLHQWVPEDVFLRTDFNEDLEKIDTALDGLNGGKAEIFTGSYAGDDAMSRFIDLGFTPKAVLVVRSDGAMKSSQACYGGLAITGAPVVHGGTTMIAIVDGGFQLVRGYLSGNSYWSDANSSNFSYYYVAIV